MSDTEPTEQKDISEILAELEKLRRDNSNLSKRLRYLEAGRSGKGKISKWSKVKGALGWPNQTELPGGGKEQTSGTVENLKVPQTPSDPSSSFSVSPSGSCVSQASSSSPPPPIFSSDSSEDEFHVKGRSASTSEPEKGAKEEEARRSKSLDGNATCPIEIHNKSSCVKDTKEHKTPWSKVKGIIHPVRATRKRSCPDDKWQNESPYRERVEQDLNLHSLTPKLTVTLPSNEQLASPDRCSKKQKRLELEHGSRSAPSSPVRSCSFTFELSPQESDGTSSGGLLDGKDEVFQNDEDLRCEIEASYVKLQARLKDEFARKIEKIVERRKIRAKESNQADLSPEFKKKLEEWNKIKTHGKSWEIKERKRYFKSKNRLKEDRPKKTEQQNRQEVLIPTSTGMFRFEGISHKFTRRLAEWERARGITPEESTFALLNPVYKPIVIEERQGNGGIVRSKSIGSVADLASGTTVQMARHSSSLSLNDVEQLHQVYSGEFPEDPVLEEPEDFDNNMDQGASCCYATEDLMQMDKDQNLEDSSMYRRKVVDSSYHLLQENICLLDKLKKERDACLELEDEMDHLEGQIHDVTKSFNRSGLDRENPRFHFEYEYETNDYDTGVMDLDESDERLFQCVDMRSEYGVKLDGLNNIQSTFFDDEATSQTAPFNCPHSYSTMYERRDQISIINNIIAELLDLADRLELAVEERDKEVFHIKNELYQTGCQHSQYKSNYTLPIHCLRGRRSQELSRLPKILYEKVLDLKKAINLVAFNSEGISTLPRTLQRCTAHEDLSPSEFRPPSRASSSASSFSYQHSVQHVPSCDSPQDWASYTNHRISRQSLLYRALTQQGAKAAGSDSLTDVSEGGSSMTSRTTSNVFVPTTRKIFSTVSQTEAVEVVLGEEKQELVDDEKVSFEEGEDDEKEKREKILEVQEEILDDGKSSNEYEGVPPPRFHPPLRSQSSSPVVNRKPPQFSSVNPLPNSENPRVEPLYEHKIEPMKLGEELTSSLKQRALKISRAKEQFLKGEHENSLSILVDSLDREPAVTLMVKAASTEQLTTVTAQPVSVHRDQRTPDTEFRSRNSSSLMGLLRLRRKASSSDKDSAVSALVRQSLVLTPPTTVACDPSQTKSCPSSPVLNKKNESNSWIKNPAKIIFRPKGKYTINNK